MQKLISNIRIAVNPKIYVKDPESSDLGRRIISESINLLDKIGFEEFTFKKLGDQIGSNESSIYRYFENKHKLLVYLCSWYWGWIEYQMAFSTANIANPTEKLKAAIKVVTRQLTDDPKTDFLNEQVLQRIVISEFFKVLQTREVDDENKEGFFLIYKGVINSLRTIIEEVNPDYPFSRSLASTVVAGSLHQQFLGAHLKTITNVGSATSATEFYTHLTLKTLTP